MKKYLLPVILLILLYQSGCSSDKITSPQPLPSIKSKSTSFPPNTNKTNIKPNPSKTVILDSPALVEPETPIETPEDPKEKKEFLIEEGDQFLIAGKPYQAIDRFDKVLKIEDDRPRANLGKAITLWQIGRKKDSQEVFETHVDIGEFKAGRFINVASYYYETDRLRKALKNIQKALKLDPSNREAKILTALIYMKMKKRKKALNFISKALKDMPESEIRYDLEITKANILYELERYDEAEKALLYATKSKKHNLIAYYFLAEIYNFIEKPEKTLWAVRQMEIAEIEKDVYFSKPQNLCAFLIIAGAAYQENEQYDKSIEYFNKAMKLDPGNTTLIFLRGYTLFEKGDLEKARADMREWLHSDMDSDDEESIERIGWAYAILGNREKALKYTNKALIYEKGKDSEFENKRMLVVRGEILHMLGDKKGAYEDFKNAGVLTDRQSMKDLASAYWEKVILQYIGKEPPK